MAALVFVVGTPVLFLAGSQLAEDWGLDPRLPVRDQEFGWAFTGAVVLVMWVIIALSMFAINSCVLLWLWVTQHWSWTDAFNATFGAQIPEQWCGDAARGDQL